MFKHIHTMVRHYDEHWMYNDEQNKYNLFLRRAYPLAWKTTDYSNNLRNSIRMQGLPRWLSGKESACQGRRWGFDPWVREGNSNPLQYSCMGKPMDREAWQATVHRVAKETRLKRLNNNIKV